MAKKLAITISGAVSLGSYESGVIFEVLDALAQHNQWASASNLSDERIEIDVLTKRNECVFLLDFPQSQRAG